jgi:hypothetical protein
MGGPARKTARSDETAFQPQMSVHGSQSTLSHAGLKNFVVPAAQPSQGGPHYDVWNDADPLS